MTALTDDPRIDELTIRIHDIQASGHCVRGAKRWFEHYGFDFRQVVKEGVSARALLDTGDAQAIAVVQFHLNNRMVS